MLAQEVIRKKRYSELLSKEEIKNFIDGVSDESISDAQIAALTMAICINKLSIEERVSLTNSMAYSGTAIDWSNKSLDGPVMDKHSTGGVGDKVSLILAPLVAACGGYVPMISGRGLGHTGGTLDKMDSIPGYVSHPELESFIAVVKNAGCAICGQTHDLAPADKRIYSVRDVTGTVESVDLITSSILSKKIAAGINALVMDIKVGSGAFMQTLDEAQELAQSIVSVANGSGMKCSAIITDMNQVLGTSAGNAIEVIECIKFMRGDYQDEALLNIVLSLTSELLVMGGISDDKSHAKDMAQKHIDDGRALSFFERMVADLGGPANISEKFEDVLELGKIKHEVYPDKPGVISSIDVRKVGLSVIELGGGRRRVSDTIDYSVGLDEIAQIGDTVGSNDKPLAIIYGNDKDKISTACDLILDAFSINEDSCNIVKPELIKKHVAA